MIELEDYQQDGASNSARAVLAYLQGMNISDVPFGMNFEAAGFFVLPYVHTWMDGRERGYSVMCRVSHIPGRHPDRPSHSLGIIFYEHRSSDVICVVVTEYPEFRYIPPGSPWEVPEKYRDALYEPAATFPHEEAYEAADWIRKRVAAFWEVHYRADAQRYSETRSEDQPQ